MSVKVKQIKIFKRAEIMYLRFSSICKLKLNTFIPLKTLFFSCDSWSQKNIFQCDGITCASLSRGVFAFVGELPTFYKVTLLVS